MYSKILKRDYLNMADKLHTILALMGQMLFNGEHINMRKIIFTKLNLFMTKFRFRFQNPISSEF